MCMEGGGPAGRRLWLSPRVIIIIVIVIVVVIIIIIIIVIGLFHKACYMPLHGC